MWKYLIIALPHVEYEVMRNGVKTGEKRNATDVLNEWGGQGYECFHVTNDGMAYLKRFTPLSAPATPTPSLTSPLTPSLTSPLTPSLTSPTAEVLTDKGE